MPTAKKLPSGQWRTLAYAGKDSHGQRHYKSFTSESKKESEYQAAEFEYKHKKLNKAGNLTFQAASDEYIQNKGNLLSPATIRGYRVIQKNALPMLLDKPIGKLAESDLIQKQINENGKKYSAKSLRNQLGFVTAVLGYFNYHIEPVTLKQKEIKEVLVPTKKDAEKIMELLHSAPRIECQALLALTCSLRQSEIAGLTAKDIEGSEVSVHGAMVPDENNKLVYKPTNKSDAGTRKVIMPDYLAGKMADLCKDKKPNDLIFSTNPVQVLYYFKKLLKANGLPPYTMHSLRHCFAAIMHAKNVPDKYVMEMGGWSSDYVMKKIYQYTFEDETSKAKKRANKYFNSALMKTEKK